MAVSTQEAHDLFFALLRVHKLLLASRNATPGLHPGFDATAYPVLFAVAAAEQARISDLADSLHNDVSTVSRQVSTFVTHGLMAKLPDATDGRAHVVTLTDAGRAAVREIQASRAEWFQGLLEDWDAERAESFTEQLRSLGSALDDNLRARGATPPAMPFIAPTQTKED
ncbi:MAG: MarR family winged helix-turn-helix transcriptional regulator [Terracoccus sp.]